MVRWSHPPLFLASPLPLTCDLIPFQVDALQCRGSRQGLREVPELVVGEVDGAQVQQGAQLLGQAVQEVALQVEFWKGNKADAPFSAAKLPAGDSSSSQGCCAELYVTQICSRLVC